MPTRARAPAREGKTVVRGKKNPPTAKRRIYALAINNALGYTLRTAFALPPNEGETIMVKLGKKWDNARISELRYEARLQVLDGKVARAKALNKLADKKERQERREQSRVGQQL